ncbi:MAG: trypsin-like peptidase domain-containing protein [Eubacteriales bacterium]|nr:trypsin-like peptidase domain-containing protein [Eubacteriales bacterium]
MLNIRPVKNKEKLSALVLIISGAVAGALLTWLIVFLTLIPRLDTQTGNSADYQTETTTNTSSTDGSTSEEVTSKTDAEASGSQNSTEESTSESETKETTLIDLSLPGDGRIEAIAEKLLPSIAGVRVESFLPGTDIAAVSEGSGVIYSHDGYILTNNHVVASAYSRGELIEQAVISVFLYGESSPYDAVVVGRDASTDLALLKITAANLPSVSFGNSDDLKTGELAVAIGSPSGLQLMGSVTSGIISGLDRQVQLENGSTMALIQTDAAVNTGNSGGALINEHGQVIGINNSGLVKSQFEGINFAIPANTAVEIAEELKKRPINPGQPWLGVSLLSDLEYAEMSVQFGWPDNGVYIHEVQTDSPAEQAGLRSGDIIIGFDDDSVLNTSDFANQLQQFYAGQWVDVRVFRSETTETLTITVVLGQTLN